ncbi:MAG: DUF503 domain-containing protein [Kofleriaceae bacterium]
MYVGIAKISLVIGESHSLKEKRMVVRRIKDRVRERVGVIVNEVGSQDSWQRAELGCAVTSGEAEVAGQLLDDVVRVIASAALDGGAEVAAIAREVTPFTKPAEPIATKPAASALEWVPSQWLEESK